MKKFFPLLCVLLLSACFIGVDDFGGYWDKGIIDKNLFGKWGDGRGWQFSIIDNGNTYKICTEKDPGHPEQGEDCSSVGRTLKAGDYTFVMSKQPNEKGGSLHEYKFEEDALILFLAPKEARLKAFVKQIHPEWDHLIAGSNPPVTFIRSVAGSEMKVTALNDEALKMLSAHTEYCTLNSSRKFCGEKMIFKKGAALQELKQQEAEKRKAENSLYEKKVEDIFEKSGINVYVPSIVPAHYKLIRHSLNPYSNPLVYELLYMYRSDNLGYQAPLKIYSFIKPGYFNPPADCGHERPEQDAYHTWKRKCQFITKLDNGSDLYEAHTSTNMYAYYTVIGNTEITLKTASQDGDHKDVINLFNSLQKKSLEELKMLK